MEEIRAAEKIYYSHQLRTWLTWLYFKLISAELEELQRKRETSSESKATLSRMFILRLKKQPMGVAFSPNNAASVATNDHGETRALKKCRKGAAV